MNALSREFVSEEQRPFRFRLGRTIASALAGFVAGVVLTSIVWYAAVYSYGQLAGPQ